MRDLLLMLLLVSVSQVLKSSEVNIGSLLIIVVYSKYTKSFRSLYLIVSILILKELANISYLKALIEDIHIKLHSSFSHFIQQYFANDFSSFLVSITIGTADTKLPKRIYDLFKQFNLLHVVSISGANFALIKEVFEKINSYINKKTLYLLIIIIQTYYILLIGFANLPALRAYIFSIISGYSIIIGRPIGFTNKLLFTVLVIIGINADALSSKSLILSVGFCILYKVFDFRALKRIFDNELKKLTLIFIISMLIFNSSQPDFIANIVFAILYPFIFISTFIAYILNGLNFNINGLTDVIYLLAKTILGTLDQLSSTVNVFLQLGIFLAILITILKTSLNKRLYEHNKFY